LKSKSDLVTLPKGFYRVTLLIGLGFFTMGLMDPLYDAYVPLFLADYISSRFLIGFIMTLDNIFALLLIPIVAALSDRTRTPIGRRMPYILVTLPLSALFFALIPQGALPGGSLVLLVGLIFFLNIFKQAARGPVVALMPDLTNEEFRSQANGVINVMGGVAAIVGTVILAPMMDIDLQLPLIGSTLRRLPFLLSSVLVILAVVLLFAFVREPKQPETLEKETKPSIKESISHIFGTGTNQDTSGRYVLLALFCWFLGYQGVLPFVTTYSRDVLQTTEGLAGLSPGAVAIAYALFAIPSGVLAAKIGRKKVIRGSLIGITINMAIIFFHYPITQMIGLSVMAQWVSFLVLLFFFGMFWGSVVTNSFPMLWHMADYQTMGIYTGMYYVFSQGAAITAPLLSGGIIDLGVMAGGEVFGLRTMFAYGSICMLIAFGLMGRVSRES
jgi:maltose/moltooligosaccharide transporter